MNLKEQLNQIADEAVVANDKYVDFIYSCIVDNLEAAAKQGLLSDKLDVVTLRRRCAFNPDGEFEGPRAVAWSDGLSKAIDLIVDGGITVGMSGDAMTDHGWIHVDWAAS